MIVRGRHAVRTPPEGGSSRPTPEGSLAHSHRRAWRGVWVGRRRLLQLRAQTALRGGGRGSTPSRSPTPRSYLLLERRRDRIVRQVEVRERRVPRDRLDEGSPPRSATWFDSRFRYSSVVFTAIAAESARAPASEIWLRARSSRSSFGSDAFRYLRSSARGARRVSGVTRGDSGRNCAEMARGRELRGRRRTRQ